MESGPQAQGDILQVIPRRPSADGTGAIRLEGTGSIRFRLAPARRKKLTRIVVATLAACGLILLAAGIAHVVRPSNDEAYAATPSPLASAAAVAPVAPAAQPPAAAPPPAPVADTPQTGTLRIQHPATPGKVWLDGEKISAASATVACGKHQLKIGAHGKARAIDIPCGGELKVAR